MFPTAMRAAPTLTRVDPVVVVRGNTIDITGTGLSSVPAGAVEVRLTQDDLGQPCAPGAAGLLGALPVQQRAQKLTALVPESVPLGEYGICVFGTTNSEKFALPVPILSDNGRLRVRGDSAARVTVSSVYQTVNYVETAGAHKGCFHFVVLGEGFSRVGVDNELLYEGGRIPICWRDGDVAVRGNACRPGVGSGREGGAGGGSAAVCDLEQDHGFGRVVSQQQLEFDLPEKYWGPQALRIAVGDAVSDPPVAVVLAPVRRSTPIVTAVLVLVLLIAMVAWLLGTRRSSYKIAGRDVSLLSALLLDPATDTYSLSKAQFYAWTAAAAFGYSYLTLARSLIQGHFEFAPIPENLPGILAVSVGTATVGLGVNNVRPKGAGNVQPGLADFITSGGVVAAERLQFLVWTVLGLLIFVMLVITSDPATIATLPTIPEGFLYLMGISSFGYLGGRLARKGGPIIDEIIADVSSLTLEIHGRNLSKDASFRIDTEDVTLDMLSGERRAEFSPKDDESQDTTLAKILKLTMPTPKPAWTTRASHPDAQKRTHTLTIINPDGQKADWPFSIAGPTAAFTAMVNGQEGASGETLEVKTTGSQATSVIVKLDASAVVPGNDPKATYEWKEEEKPKNVGKGPKWELEGVSVDSDHTFTLIVTDSASKSSSASVKIRFTKP